MKNLHHLKLLLKSIKKVSSKNVLKPLKDKNGQLNIVAIILLYPSSASSSHSMEFRTENPLTTNMTKLTILILLEQ